MPCGCPAHRFSHTESHLGSPENAGSPGPGSIDPQHVRPAADLGTTVNVLVDGARPSGYPFMGEEIDLIVKSEEKRDMTIQDLSSLPVIAPTGEKVTLASVAEIKLTEPGQMNHIRAERAITIQIIPPMEIALETATQLISEKVIEPSWQWCLGNRYRIDMAGTADDLTRTRMHSCGIFCWQWSSAICSCQLCSKFSVSP